MVTKKTIYIAAAVMAVFIILLLTAAPVPLQATEDEPLQKANTVDDPGGSTVAEDDENYVIQPGDTLWGIARERKLDIGLLAAINDLPEDARLEAGQEIRIPRGNSIPHVVAPGETLWGIAALYNVDINEIIGENDLDDPDNLKAGDELLVPADIGQAYAGGGLSRHNWQLPLWPTFGVVSSAFGPRDGRRHEGLDIAADKGMPIRAVKSGRVVFAGERGSYGKAVIINHGGGLRTLYAHASEIVISEGELVEEGQEIARVGSTGRSTGPHLHFELLYRGTPLDPAKYLPEKN